MLFVNDLIDKKLISAKEMFRGGKEYLTLFFKDEKTGETFKMTISSERGGDLYLSIKTTQ